VSVDELQGFQTQFLRYLPRTCVVGIRSWKSLAIICEEIPEPVIQMERNCPKTIITTRNAACCLHGFFSPSFSPPSAILFTAASPATTTFSFPSFSSIERGGDADGGRRRLDSSVILARGGEGRN